MAIFSKEEYANMFVMSSKKEKKPLKNKKVNELSGLKLGASDLWHNPHLGLLWLLIYRRTISSSATPTVSAKYPPAQRLSPHKNSSSSGNSCRSTLLVPPLNFCTTLASDISGPICTNICMWSGKISNSSVFQPFIWQAWYIFFLTFQRVSLLGLAYGIGVSIQGDTFNLCFVCAPVQYLPFFIDRIMPKSSSVCKQACGKRMPFIPRFKSLGFSAMLYK